VDDKKFATVTYLCQNSPDVPETARNVENKTSIFGEKIMILHSESKKKPRNFHGSNVAGLGVFQTDSILTL